MGSSSPKKSESSQIMFSSEYDVVVSARVKHTATLIFRHGLGDTGDGWASSMADVRPAHVKIICPTARVMPVTLNSGLRMPAWFDLMSLNVEGPEDAAGIRFAKSRIESIIAKEISNGIPAQRIVLGGFSQGGALALYAGPTGLYTLGGVIALSCWLPLHKEFNCSGKESVPVLQLHGDCDPVVPYRWGQLSSTTLKNSLRNHEFKTYEGLAHQSSKEELDDVKIFLSKVLKP
uniref:palmitoyl-protein hydrolase n=1 Tax=Lepeophtheirus salmonis TaxID=72036 RepID=C1BTL5_LEPSM|nr:Acyl-protein thioesterase 1 [Lepeophtheirus salmonis]